MKLTIQLKARDLINKHAYAVDPKNDMEFRICDPQSMLDYLNPEKVGYRPYNASKKTCNKCIRVLGGMVAEYGKDLILIRSQSDHMDNARRMAARVSSKKKDDE